MAATLVFGRATKKNMAQILTACGKMQLKKAMKKKHMKKPGIKAKKKSKKQIEKKAEKKADEKTEKKGKTKKGEKGRNEKKKPNTLFFSSDCFYARGFLPGFF
jgi:hypothetical protein